MRTRASLLPVFLAAAAVGVISIAVPEARAQSSVERECRELVARQARSYLTRSFKTLERCHKKRSKGALSLDIDCNSVAEADLKFKLPRHRTLLGLELASPRSPCASAPDVLAEFPRCPSPAADADDGETTTGIDSYTELAICLTSLIDELGGQATARAMGAPSARLRAQAQGCQRAVGKRLRRLLEAYMQERTSCQLELDLQAGEMAYGCHDYESDGKIAAARARLEQDIESRCALDDTISLPEMVELDALDACGDSPEQLRRCVVESVGNRLGAGLAAMLFELPGECAAGTVVRISKAGTGEGLTESSFSGGWNGIGHDIDLTDNFRDAMALSCDDDCAGCSSQLDALVDEPDSYCRCVSDPTLHCDTVAGPDIDDCGLTNNQCRCYLGPPVAVSAGGAPACITVRINEGHGGEIDVGRGDWHSTLGLAAVMHLGTDLKQPCPICEGDPVMRDGIRGGTCRGGTRAGQPCDTNAEQPTFGPSSYDCLPLALTNISGGGLGLFIDMTTEPSTLASELACDSPGGMCPCRVCSGDTTLGCTNDATCTAAGMGACTGGGGAGVQPNACSDRICGADGLCAAGPFDRYCDGETYADGRGYIACLTDVDCGLLGAGTCTLLERRRCYPDPITTGGAAGFFGGVAGTVGCLGLTSSAVINQATGLPGAIRVVLDFDAEVRCADDPTKLFEPPGGSNCLVTPSTTTTTLLPPLPCALSLPTCGGECPVGSTCQISGLSCVCAP